MELLALVLGVGLAAVGGDRFVRGCVGASVSLRIPAGIIGATVAAFATSTPELVVSVVAASGGDSAIALGDATGSNVVNLGLVLGMALVAVPMVVDRGDLRRDAPAVLVAMVLLAALGADGTVSRIDAAVLLALFVGWATWAAYDARRARDATEEVIADATGGSAVLELVLGAVLLVAAGRLVVIGAKWAGDALGWDEFLTGALLVSLATSTPELVTTFLSVRRGHADVGVGALLGSNVFNSAFVVGVAAAISPIAVDWSEVAVALAIGTAAVLLVLPGRTGRLGRGRGVALLGLYGAYLALLLALR